ncbi:MAG: cysteine desulfurase [Cryomorphaceae bacterium]|nr:MAG: cysteine desulfurase [Cryomorphaceae bacterium]
MAHTLEAPGSFTAFAEGIRKQFPLLNQQVNGRPLVYFDNAATTQKPVQVIEAMNRYYREYNSNVHRGVHHLSQVATDAMEQVRLQMAGFLGASRHEEIIFTSGCTGGINLAAHIMGRAYLRPGDEILLTEMEHHSNIVPWQLAAEISGAIIKVIPVLEDGTLDLEACQTLLSPRTKVVAFVHVSNALGTINPAAEIISMAKNVGALTLVDGAQALAHERVNVQNLNCDFYVTSAHKHYGPTGMGVLYGRYELLEKLPPYQGGGEMIDRVTFDRTTYNTPPFKFEAGTPNIAGIIGMGASIQWLLEQDIDQVKAYEHELLAYATQTLSEIEGFVPVGTAADKAAVVSFNLKGVHHYDVGVLLDKMGLALRTGHHCTQPLMDRYAIEGTVRASFAPYNTFEEIDRLVEALRKAQQMLS